jgi:hypothetical protein
MADMVTNTVGIMLFILIFVSLSAGGTVIAKHLPHEHRTKAKVLWLFCSQGRVIQFDPFKLYDAHVSQTEAFSLSTQTTTDSKLLFVRLKPNHGDDEPAIKVHDSAFQTLLRKKNGADSFLFFFVTPDSIALFREARDEATHAGFGVGWSPLAPGEAAPLVIAGKGELATIQ